MKGTSIFVVAASAVLMLAGCTMLPPPGPGDATILDGVKIVDVDTGTATPPQAILIENGVIAEIADRPAADWPSAALRPDVTGLYVSPALIDTHAHIFDERDLAMISTFGVAAMRNMDGWPWHLRLRDAQSTTVRAELSTSGQQFQSSNFSSTTALVDAILKERSDGVDWIKLYDDIDLSVLSAISAAAPASDLNVSGHLHDNTPATALIASGVFDDIAHAEELLAAMRVEFGNWREGVPDVAKAMRETDTALSTTIVNNKMIFEQGRNFDAVMGRNETRYAPPLLQVFWASPFNPYRGEGEPQGPRESKQVKALLDMTALLHEQGVTILAGTDAPNPTTVPGAAMHEELELLVSAGLSPAEAMETATSIAAEHVRFQHPRGRVETGYAADLILTATNPLDDIAALGRFDALIRGGAYAPADVALAEREALAKAYEQDKEVLNLFDPGSADAIVAALNAAQDQPAINREALTSVIWAYWKFGNLPAAKELAAVQQELFPDDADALYVAEFMSGQ